MDIEKYILRFKYLDSLIQRHATGSPSELGRKLGLSKRMALKYIEYLRELGAEIDFDKNSNSYYYTEEVEFYIEFKLSKKS